MRLVALVYVIGTAIVALLFSVSDHAKMSVGSKTVAWPWSAILVGLLWPIYIPMMIYIDITGKDRAEVRFPSWFTNTKASNDRSGDL